jgi:hypothetical protein
MDKIIAIAVIAEIVSSAVKTYRSSRDIRYAPCSPFLDSTEGQEYMLKMREYAEKYNVEEVPESVRRRIMDEVLGRI